MRLIDADYLKQSLSSNCKPEICPDYQNAWCEACCPHNDFENLIDDAPTVEPKQGEWIDQSENYGYAECPFCHELTTCNEDNIDELNFCWKCGAKLRKGER